MQKRYHLKKGRISQQLKQCIVCSFKRAKYTQLTSLCSKILTNKYQAPLYACIQSHTISQLVHHRGSNHAKTIYREAVQLSKKTQMIGEYYNFQTVVNKIKPLILQRTSKDLYFVVHHHESAFEITFRHKLAIKRLNLDRAKAVNSGKKRQNQICGHQNRWQKSDKYGIPKKKELKSNNYNQTPSLRRLTRNLSNMVKRYDENLQFHPSLIFQLMDFAPSHVLDVTKMEKQELFKAELEQNISIIPPIKHNQRLKTVGCDANEDFDQNYGLRVKQKIFESRKFLKNQQKGIVKMPFLRKQEQEIKENISPNQRIHTDYENIKSKDKKPVSNKKSAEKFGVMALKSCSKKKENSKASSITKSRVSKKL